MDRDLQLEELDQVFIRNLLVRGIVGINPDERKNRQDILVNVVMWTDTRAAGASDAIEDAVNYRTAAKAMIAHIEGGPTWWSGWWRTWPASAARPTRASRPWRSPWRSPARCASPNPWA
ncbi:MAG: dihydroneopterin aldolase [Caldilineaceae bacterium]|nr:dihydroneopterin aldolase [Caldilineaceae bacterium]